MKYYKVRNKQYIYYYYLNGTKKYMVRKRVRGVKKAFFKSSLSNIEEAEKVLSETLAGSTFNRYKFSEVVDLYIKELENLKGSPTTKYGKLLMLKQISKFFENVYYDTLIYESYYIWLNALKKKDVESTTKNKFISLFEELNNFAVKKLKVKSNLNDCFERLDVTPRNEKLLSKTHEHYLTKEEVEKIIASCDSYWSLFFSCMFYFALRIGEARGLKPKYFDFENNVLYLGGNVQTKLGKGKSIDIGISKGKKLVSRRVPIWLSEKIKKYIKDNRIKDDSYLFYGRSKGSALGETTIRNHLKNIVSKLNISGVKSHSFRKAFINYMSEKGLTDDEIARYIGHTSTTVTRKSYLSLNESIIDKVLDAMD